MAGRQRSGSKGGSRSSAPKYPRGARVGATLPRDHRRRARPHRRRAAGVGDDHQHRRRPRAEPGDRVLRLARRRGRRRGDRRGARRAPRPAAVVDRPPDPGEEDADPRLPARRRHPLGRADRRDPAQRPRPDRPGGRRIRTGHAATESRPMARRKPATTHGLAVVDKPAGVTSHDVVGMLRRRFGERQVGHAGTLDPDATGVLVVGVGMATRLLRFVEKTQQAVRRRGRARRRDRHARRGRRGDRDVRHVDGDPRRRAACVVAEHLTGADHADAADGVGDPASTAGGCTSWPARASRSSASRGP